MGNTNIPQFGAKNGSNSHDTRVGAEQLSDEQIKQRDAQATGGVSELLPDSVANESQRVVEHADHGRNVVGKPHSDSTQDVGSAIAKPEAGLEPTAADREAIGGHVDTGHSPPDAT